RQLRFRTDDEPFRESLWQDRKPRTGSRKPSLVASHCPPIRGYVVIVFFEGAGEAVVTFGVGDEVIIVGLGGMHGGFEGAFAGVADGAGGQSGVDVSVVRRVEMHVVVMQRAGVGSGEKFTVNYAGVGVERDLLLQAVVVNAGDKRALLRDRGFFLDDRG